MRILYAKEQGLELAKELEDNIVITAETAKEAMSLIDRLGSTIDLFVVGQVMLSSEEKDRTLDFEGGLKVILYINKLGYKKPIMMVSTESATKLPSPGDLIKFDYLSRNFFKGSQ